jgi:phosphoenolpyruvate phosphomutase
VESLNQVGIKDVTVIRGFKKESICLTNIKTIDNDDYADTKELYSLYLAKNLIQDTAVISYGDIVFRNYILHELINDENDITIIVDAEANLTGHDKDFVTTASPFGKELYMESKSVALVKMGHDLKASEINGEFIGLWKCSGQGAKAVVDALEKLSKDKNFKHMTCIDLFNEIIKSRPIAVRFIKGSWIDVDTFVDLHKAGEL